MITVSNLNLKIRNKEILKIENLVIKDNERVAVLGANGSGKTSFCNCILEFYDTKNTIKFSQNYTRGCVFQENKYTSATKIKNLVVMYKDLYGNIDETYFNNLFESFEIFEFLEKKFKSLSGGQQQRFKIFLNLISKPQIFILDEAFSAIDKVWKEKIVGILSDFLDKNECTLFFIAHEKKNLELLCERLIIFEKGNIIHDVSNEGKDFNELIERFAD